MIRRQFPQNKGIHCGRFYNEEGKIFVPTAGLDRNLIIVSLLVSIVYTAHELVVGNYTWWCIDFFHLSILLSSLNCGLTCWLAVCRQEIDFFLVLPSTSSNSLFLQNNRLASLKFGSLDFLREVLSVCPCRRSSINSILEQ